MSRTRLPLGPTAAASLLALLIALPGCGGGGGGGTDDFAQDFEQPATPPPAVELPPDTGDELSPREKRAQENN